MSLFLCISTVMCALNSWITNLIFIKLRINTRVKGKKHPAKVKKKWKWSGVNGKRFTYSREFNLNTFSEIFIQIFAPDFEDTSEQASEVPSVLQIRVRFKSKFKDEFAIQLSCCRECGVWV